MKKRIKTVVRSPQFVLIMGLVVVPLLSFLLITTGPESPLYTSISRLAWCHKHWLATFLWAIVVMGVILLLTFRMTVTGPLAPRTQRRFLIFQTLNIGLVFVGCLMFPAKDGLETVRFVHYLHDYLTVAAWVLYAIGLLLYSLLVRRKDKFLGFLGLCLMAFTFLTSIFFVLNVIDPASYVGASAVSEVYVINSLTVYLLVMYIAQLYTNKIKEYLPPASDKT